MAKRRYRPREEERPVQDLSPAERRALRKREREGGGAQGAKGLGSSWRRAAYVGIPTAILVVVVALLILNPFHTAPPCLALQESPAGMPGFPPKGTTDFSGTWCPQNAPDVLFVHVSVTILINGQTVTIPSNIGRNSNYTGYTCELPITTQTTLSPGVVQIASPWAYIYNLSAFFYVWGQSDAGAYVNASSPSQPISYTSNSLLGYSVDPGHQITLYVDNQPSSAGPSLNLDTLPYLNDQYPTCLGTIYGTGHQVVLSYHSTHASAAVRGTVAPTLATQPSMIGGGALPDGSGATDAPLVPGGPTEFEHARLASLPFLVLRGDA